jgi:hypothetical protein
LEGDNQKLDLDDLTETDWDELLRKSAAHGISGLIFQRISLPAVRKMIPPWVIEGLSQQYSKTALKNLHIYHNLCKILTALQEVGIQVIVLKGAYLAQIIYANLGLRSMKDIDLLVNKSDLGKAEQKLLDLGYTLSGDRAWRESEHFEFCFKLPDKGMSVELHWDIEPPTAPFRIDTDGLRDRAKPARIAGVSTLVPSPEDMLIHLCLHA